MSYRILADGSLNTIARSDGAFIPCAQANMDCVQFLVDWRDGAAVEDADGQPIAYSESAVEAMGLTPVPAE